MNARQIKAEEKRQRKAAKRMKDELARRDGTHWVRIYGGKSVPVKGYCNET